MKDPVSIFGCWRGFQFADRLAALPQADSRTQRRSLRRERSFSHGALRAPAAPMNDRELSRAIADFLKGASSAESVGSLGRRIDPSSGL